MNDLKKFKGIATGILLGLLLWGLLALALFGYGLV